MRRNDLANKRFGHLTVIGCVGSVNGHSQWICRCDCGNNTFGLNTHLVRGNKKSCGCVPKRLPSNPYKYFWSRITKTDSCWIWNGVLNPKGYGTLPYHGRRIAAHRYSYFLFNQKWPHPCCLHSCDVPACVNPAHLRAGTNAENVADRIARGRQPVGEAVVNSKLTSAQVAVIRQLVDGGMAHREVARRFAISHTNVASIVHRMTWKHDSKETQIMA